MRSEGPSFHDALDPLRWAMRQRGGVFALASRAGLPLALTLVVSLRSRLHLWHLVTRRVTPPPSQDSLRDDRWIETASTASREGDGFTRSEMPSSASSPRFARSSSPSVSCDDGEVVHHLLAARIAFRLRVRQTTIENRILLPELRRTGTTIEPETFSRAGAVARFAFRRGHDTPPGEPRRSTSPSGARLASRYLPLRVGARFGIAPALAFARACTAPA